jgi:membrane-bound inhibitor of C-type lysozyme
MNKKKIVGFVVSIVVLIIILVCLINYIRQKPSLNPVAVNSEVITYYCKECIIKAVYGKNDITLSFDNEKVLLLPQTISGSGIRYELGTTTFVSKGEYAFLTEGDKQTYTNCVGGNQSSDKYINTYSDISKTFSFSYPNQLILSGGDVGYSQNWAVGSDKLGLLLTVVNIPKSFMPAKTNFSEAKFTVGTSVDPDAIKNCLIYNFGGVGTTSDVIVNNRKFTKMNFIDVGAGNYYDTTSYRTVYNGQCYAIEYTIHSSSINNYSPDQGIKAFDKTKIIHVLDGIIGSFKFL